MDKMEISKEALKSIANNMDDLLSIISSSIEDMEIWQLEQTGCSNRYQKQWYQEIAECVDETRIAVAAYRQLEEHIHYACQSYDLIQEKAARLVEGL